MPFPCREMKRKGSKETKVSEISDPILLERYVAIADYEKQKKNECSLMAGQTVEVVDKNQNGGLDERTWGFGWFLISAPSSNRMVVCECG